MAQYKLSQHKLKQLSEYLRSLKKVAVAFSGGVDSTFLLKVAHDELGKNAIAVTVKTVFSPQSELLEASQFCLSNGIQQKIVPVDVLSDYEIAKNPKNRCYLCKKVIFNSIKESCQQDGLYKDFIILDGTNFDDTKDYRPGIKALKELEIKSPLCECGFTKEEIRSSCRFLNLSVYEKPSLACLASRIPYDEEISAEKLKKVELAEEFLKTLGFKQFRVRMCGTTLARIEVESRDEMEKILENRFEIVDELKKIGFSYVSLDLQGYRTGSLNEVLKER